MKPSPLSLSQKPFLTYITIRGGKNKHSKRKTIDGHPYEFMLYLQLQRQLEAGQVFVPLSTKHRSIEEDLIPYRIGPIPGNRFFSSLIAQYCNNRQGHA